MNIQVRLDTKTEEQTSGQTPPRFLQTIAGVSLHRGLQSGKKLVVADNRASEQELCLLPAL